MPDPERLLHTLRRATAACQTMPGRRGRFVPLDGATEVLVAGDLHGHLGNFRSLMKKADLARHPRRFLVLQELIHGPSRYRTGGDKSHQLLDLFAALKCQHPRQVHFLLGNHELSQMTDRRIAKADEDLNDSFRQGVDTAYGEAGPAVYEAYLELMAATPLALRTPNRVYISHSLPQATQLERFDPANLERDPTDPLDLLPGGAVHSLVWGRDTEPATVAAFLEKVDADLLVSGHIASEGGLAVPNDRQLILDSLGYPAGYCLFPADRPLTHAELVRHVQFISPVWAG
jgi:hypothetical protein